MAIFLSFKRRFTSLDLLTGNARLSFPQSGIFLKYYTFPAVNCQFPEEKSKQKYRKQTYRSHPLLTKNSAGITAEHRISPWSQTAYRGIPTKHHKCQKQHQEKPHNRQFRSGSYGYGWYPPIPQAGSVTVPSVCGNTRYSIRAACIFPVAASAWSHPVNSIPGQDQIGDNVKRYSCNLTSCKRYEILNTVIKISTKEGEMRSWQNTTENF